MAIDVKQMSIDDKVAYLMQGCDYGDAETKRNMEKELRARLIESSETGKPLRVYLGVDPRTTDLHLGHTVPMRKLRQFQELGHTCTFLIGSFTSTIGDPSDKDKTRPQLTLDEVMANAKTYTEQAFKILDPDKTAIRYNHTWLAPLTFGELIKLAANFTVQQFLARDTFAKRYSKGDPIWLHEFFYALMQGYDAVALETDVQVGGTDQIFNIMTAGRKLQQALGQKPQVAIIVPLLPGTDGEIKMSKSLGNHIAINLAPADMYGKVMSLPDKVMPLYFKLVTRYLPAQIAAIEKAMATGSRHPRDIKMELAREIVAIFHGEGAAQEAEAQFKRVFQQRQLPTDMPEQVLTDPTPVIDLMVTAGFAKSKSEARRLIKQGGVSLDDRPIREISREISPGETPAVLKVGKRKFLRLLPS